MGGPTILIMVVRREVRHDRVDNLEQLKGRLLVEGDERERHGEGRLIEPVDDELDVAGHRAGASNQRGSWASSEQFLSPNAEVTSLGRDSSGTTKAVKSVVDAAVKRRVKICHSFLLKMWASAVAQL